MTTTVEQALQQVHDVDRRFMLALQSGELGDQQWIDFADEMDYATDILCAAQAAIPDAPDGMERCSDCGLPVPRGGDGICERHR